MNSTKEDDREDLSHIIDDSKLKERKERLLREIERCEKKFQRIIGELKEVNTQLGYINILDGFINNLTIFRGKDDDSR